MNIKKGQTVIHPGLEGPREVLEVLENEAVVLKGCPGTVSTKVLKPAPEAAEKPARKPAKKYAD